jgi:predicted nucleic acid-binding protein
VSAVVLDAGAFIAVENNDRSMIARLREAHRQGRPLRTSAIVAAQVWREPRQANLARLLRLVDVQPVDERMGREAGALLAKSHTVDPIDAALVLTAQNADHIFTSDPIDISVLVSASGRRVVVVRC